MDSQKTIEVNGKQYDAVTGAVVGAGTAPTLRRSGRNIDGFFRPRTVTTPTAKSPITVKVTTPASEVTSAPVLKKSVETAFNRTVNHARAHRPQAAVARTIAVSQAKATSQTFAVRRGPANHLKHHAAQHSRTLRRDAVPKPALSTHNLLKPKGTLQHQVPSLIALKKAADAVDPDRLARAQSAPKSPLIARHAAQVHAVTPAFVPVSVQPAPSAPPTVPTPLSGNGGAPVTPPPQPSNRPADMFAHALANADHFVDVRSHRAAYKKKARTHAVSMAAGSLVLIVIAAFVAYVNNPAMQLKVASVKAGVSANMPNFAAAGFSFNGVRAGDGKLMLGFKGKAGDYQLTQANTNLSDSDMIQTIGATDASGDPVYSVVQAGNVAVYRFSNTSATWVSGGKWYTVTGSNALSNAQVKTLVQNI